jgi:hypothetical protein
MDLVEAVNVNQTIQDLVCNAVNMWQEIPTSESLPNFQDPIAQNRVHIDAN